MTSALFTTLQPLKWWGKEENNAMMGMMGGRKKVKKKRCSIQSAKTIAKTKVYYELVKLALTPIV